MLSTMPRSLPGVTPITAECRRSRETLNGVVRPEQVTDSGRYAVSQESDRGLFKTPCLRNINVTSRTTAV